MQGAGTLGAPCASDSQCGADGTICRSSNDNINVVGSAAGGFCTISCIDFAHGTTNVDPCVAIGGHCYGYKTSALAWCLEACAEGDAGPKCHGREDFACLTALDRDDKFATYDYCWPVCGAQSDCGEGSGRACDPLTRWCTNGGIHKGDPDGTACDPNANTCAGRCTKFGAPDGKGGITPAYVCGATCVQGFNPDGCGPMEACLYSDPGDHAGDQGYCKQLCDTVADCKDTVHQVVCDPGTKANYKHGSCSIVGLGAAADAGADASDAGGD